MMGHRQKLAGDGYDAFTRWRRLLSWRPGQRAWIKRRYSKKQRKAEQFLDALSEVRRTGDY